MKIKIEAIKEKSVFLKTEIYPVIFWGSLILIGLYIISNYNYVFFHTLAEAFSIVIAIGISVIVWNSRKFFDNDYIVLIGIAYLFIAGIDLAHIFAYPGVELFEEANTNLASQLWIFARYFQAITLLIAPIFIIKKLNVRVVIGIYALITGGFLASIFLGVFPTTFIEGSGLTQFKIISEYIISTILIASIFFLWRYKDKFNKNVFYLLIGSIILTVFSEISFTFYVSAYDISNLIGHLLKIIAFYLLYKALIEANLVRIKIKRILFIGAGFSIILVLMFSFVTYLSFTKVAEENERELIAQEIHKTVSELDILLYEYITYRGERMLQQWDLKYSNTAEILEKTSPVEELEIIKSDYSDLKDLFSQITANYDKQGSLELEERLVAQFLIKSQKIIFAVSAIAEEAYSGAIEAQEKANNLTLVSLAVLFSALIGISIYIGRRITKPLDSLTESTRIIAKGDLKHKIEVKGEDEIAELATDFNIMTVALERSEKKILEEKDFSESIISSLPGVFYLFDDKGKLLKWNKNFEKVTKYSKDEMAKLQHDKLFSGEAKDFVAKTIKNAFKKGIVEVEANIISKNGTKTPFYMTVIYFTREGKSYVVGTGIDLSKIRKTEAALKSSEDQYEFISMIGHQLRTPVTSARSLLEVISEEDRTENIKAAHEKINSLSDIVGTLLFYIENRGKEGMMEKDGRNVEIIKSIKAQISLLKDSIEDKKITISQELPSKATVKGDRVIINRILYSVLENAVVYNKEHGNIDISIKKEDDSILLKIKDTGYGIPEKEQNKVFAEYFRATNASLGINEGSGLSLYLVSTMIKSLGGEIYFESIENKGSTFYLRFPIFKEDN